MKRFLDGIIGIFIFIFIFGGFIYVNDAWHHQYWEGYMLGKEEGWSQGNQYTHEQYTKAFENGKKYMYKEFMRKNE
jgi:hypothetical protein